MAAPDSAQLVREAKTFTTNAQRTPETTKLVVRAMIAYESELSTWLANNEQGSMTPAWLNKYDEWCAITKTLKALGVQHT